MQKAARPGSARKLSVALYILVGIHGIVRQADADDEATERARKHFVQAQKAYDLGNWDEAAREFSWAYELRPDPIFLYNMAQAYRRGGNLQRAIDLYKNYLLKDPNSPQRADVEQRVQRLQKQLDDERGAKAVVSSPTLLEPAAAQPPEPVGNVPAISPAAPALQAAADAPPATTPDPGALTPPSPASADAVPKSELPAAALTTAAPRPAAGRGLRVAGVVAGAVGLVGIGGGVFFSLRARSLSDSVSSASRYSPDDAQSGKNAAVLQWVCYGAGGAAVVTGALLYWKGRRQGADQPTFSLVPLLGPNSVGLASAGRF